MAKGYDQHQGRVQALNWFGKDLARRARSSCEICESSGVPLAIHEVPPVPKEPDFDVCLFAYEICRQALENPKLSLDGQQWRSLANTIWSDVPAVQVAVARLLNRAARSQNWARETLDEAYFSPEVEEWIEKP